jgi:hypothetical protein
VTRSVTPSRITSRVAEEQSSSSVATAISIYQQMPRSTSLNRQVCGGQIRMRVRYKSFKSPWFDYLFVSRAELEEILDGTGWQVKEVVAMNGPNYVALIERLPV